MFSIFLPIVYFLPVWEMNRDRKRKTKAYRSPSK
jgi:hypothetical protein